MTTTRTTPIHAGLIQALAGAFARGSEIVCFSHYQTQFPDVTPHHFGRLESEGYLVKAHDSRGGHRRYYGPGPRIAGIVAALKQQIQAAG